MPKGILRKDGKSGRAAIRSIPADELLPQYEEYMNIALKENKCKTEADAIKKKIYIEIVEAIQKKFEEKKLYGVRRYNIIYFDETADFNFDDKLKAKYQCHFNEIVISSIQQSVERRIDGTKKYKYELNDWQKKLMQNYLEQLLGKTTETIEIPEEDEEDDVWLAVI